MPLPPSSTELFEALLKLGTSNLRATLSQVSDLVAATTGAHKVDSFLYDAARDSLVAIGVSNQPLSERQKRLGLDVLPLSNGGRTVDVFRTGITLLTGHLENDEMELRGIRDALGIRSTIGVAFEVGGERRGVLLVASGEPDHFSDEDARFLESIARWIGIVAHRAELIEQIERDAVQQGRRAGAEEILSVVAHDMRNFLSPLSARLDWLHLRTQQSGEKDMPQQVELARQSLARLRGLIDDMLNVSRIDAGIFSVSAERVDLGVLVKACAAPLSSAREPVNVQLVTEESIVVSADPNRLRQCLENLITNAINVSPSGVPVRILVKRKPRDKDRQWASVEICDEGPGIPAEFLPRIFDRFVTGSPREGGLGLGLYIAKRIAALHGGDLSVESTPGRGARFILLLPAAASEPATA
jgi:signal transduction histidine kinase